MAKKAVAIIVCATMFAGIMACERDDTGDNTPVGGFSDNGASRALFSVSASKQVRFSRGNLQYRVSTKEWSFAEKQDDFVGEANVNNSRSVIDLFGWGTSGWQGGSGSCYLPEETSKYDEDYRYGVNPLTGSNAEADWAWHNKIKNGGNKTHMWRTLSVAEWKYLFNERPDAEYKYGIASIDHTAHSYYGIVILPDDWRVPPKGINFYPGGNQTNVYSREEWNRMEEFGAIFLPAAGFRYTTQSGFHNPELHYEKNCAVYWSVTPAGSDKAYALYYDQVSISGLNPSKMVARSQGLAVRPVMDKE